MIVRGPVVTREYVTRPEANALAKIAAGPDVWHRMGDAGYLDAQERFWFCGRVAHRVLTAAGPMYPIPCEAIFKQHADVRRGALVGVGPPARQRPVMILEPQPGRMPAGRHARQAWLEEVRRLGREQSVDRGNRRFPRPSGLSRGHPPQREDISGEAGRLGCGEDREAALTIQRGYHAKAQDAKARRHEEEGGGWIDSRATAVSAVARMRPVASPRTA